MSEVRQRLYSARRFRGAALQPGIAGCIKQGLEQAGLPATAVQVVATTDRAAVGELLELEEFVDVIVPRGGKGLIERLSARVANSGD